LGLGSSVSGRKYGDSPCEGAADVGHYGGAITNNFVVANDARLLTSGDGFDTGIGLEQSCDTHILHNTVVSTVTPRSSSIEWRFANTFATVANNLVTHRLLARDSARATLVGNVVDAPLSLFVDVPSGNLHLLPAATAAIDKAAPLATPLPTDIDAESRGVAADVGADEYMATPVTFALSASMTAAGDAIEVRWATSGGASSADWVGLYAADAPDSTWLERKSTEGQPTGTLYFTAPPTAGTYQSRYFSGSGVRVAISNPIIVTAARSGGPEIR
jgi:hypothetical protein